MEGLFCFIFGGMKMNSILSKIIIRPLNQIDNIDELTLLLHKSYKKLGDQGFHFLATYQDSKTTKQRLSNSECYVAILDNKLIGTISYRSPKVKAKHEY